MMVSDAGRYQGVGQGREWARPDHWRRGGFDAVKEGLRRGLRILHILNHVEEVGNGIVNVAVDIACLQADLGHHVWVVSAGGAYEGLLEDHGVAPVRLAGTGPSMQSLPLAVLRLRRLVAQIRPEVMHAHMMTGAVLAWIVRPRARYRLVCTCMPSSSPAPSSWGWAIESSASATA